ncbi:hypothetical protein [Lacrimispora sp.]|uniref:hypothetical protein n=1 Tax=Lacrimispora sp. TaxID=2719234 RepID=UPI00285BD263|nr:hypothetical protein [Lacrimispora sp.]MDR7814121.1 hypothetical protein [Lacrimispora sp.]
MKDVAKEEGFKKDFSSKVTFSAGMAECKDFNVSEALINADRKLYEAKENGRNQTRY